MLLVDWGRKKDERVNALWAVLFLLRSNKEKRTASNNCLATWCRTITPVETSWSRPKYQLKKRLVKDWPWHHESPFYIWTLTVSSIKVSKWPNYYWDAHKNKYRSKWNIFICLFFFVWLKQMPSWLTDGNWWSNRWLGTNDSGQFFLVNFILLKMRITIYISSTRRSPSSGTSVI